MPRLRRRPKHKTVFHSGHLVGLITGHDFFNGYGHGKSLDLVQMRVDYEGHRDEVFAGLAERVRDGRSQRLRPWSYYLVELRMDPNDIPREQWEEREVLEARRLLTGEERRTRSSTLAHRKGEA